MYRTFNVFRVSVKLNTNGEYFNKELTNYINKRSLEVEKLANKQSLKKIKQFKHEFDNYIKKRKNLSSDVLDFELIKKLKNEGKKIPKTLVVSACAMDSDINKAKELGIEDYLTKPIDIVGFLNAVKKLIN